VFGSEPNDGQIFIAERSRKGSHKLLWSVMPEAPIAADAGMRAGVAPQWAKSAQITSPGPPGSARRVGGACKMRRPATWATFQFESRRWRRSR